MLPAIFDGDRLSENRNSASTYADVQYSIRNGAPTFAGVLFHFGNCAPTFADVLFRFGNGAPTFADVLFHFGNGVSTFADVLFHAANCAPTFADVLFHAANGASRFADVLFHAANGVPMFADAPSRFKKVDSSYFLLLADLHRRPLITTMDAQHQGIADRTAAERQALLPFAWLAVLIVRGAEHVAHDVAGIEGDV